MENVFGLSKEHERLGELLSAAFRRAQGSLATAERLLEGGFSSPAFVWAVRSVEIYVKEFLLAPALLSCTDDDWIRALRRAGKLFGDSNWDRAYAKLEEFCGPTDQMLTEDGEDAWKYWKTRAVRLRGHVVHGNWLAEPEEATEQDAWWAISYGKQLFTQMTMRMIVSQRHPASEVFLEVMKRVGREIHSDSSSEGE